MSSAVGWAWRESAPRAELRFLGKGQPDETAELLSSQETQPPSLAWARQIHSRRVLPAQPGLCGEGDALWTREPGIALCVVTADCVPVLFAGAQSVAAAHAGWRGIVAGVVSATLEALPEAPAALTAWIGPAIGPCCYEVGEDVARQVVEATDTTARRETPAKPHLDLKRAVEVQLHRAGVSDVRRVDFCTRCEAEDLFSYRREGPGGGRNRSLIWRTP